MDPKIIESELRAHKVREGPIYKRTKFLLEWRERWMVLTMNYIFVFTNRNLKQVTQYLDLRQVKSYKSYLKKDDDMIPAGFKIRTNEDMFYFCARNSNQKWSWIVSIERLMDFKYTGKSPYNNGQWIKTKGFMGQAQFQRGMFDQDQPKVIPPVQEPPKPAKVQEKVGAEDYQKLLKILQSERQQIKKKQQSFIRKQKEQEELFLFELNKLKKAEQQLKQITIQVEEKEKELKAKQTELEQKSIQIQRQLTQNIPKQIVKEVIIQKYIEVEAKQPRIKPQIKQQEVKSSQIKEQVKQEELKEEQDRGFRRDNPTSQRVSDMKKIFESLQQKKNPTTSSLPLKPAINIQKRTSKQQISLHVYRDQIIVNLFKQFHSNLFSYNGLRHIMEFLIKISAQRSLGYQQYLVRQAKSNENRYHFAEVLLQFINDYNDYANSQKMAKVIQILIFEAPGIFKLNHFDLIKRKLIDLLNHTSQGSSALNSIFKTMYVVHKMKPFDKNVELKQRINKQLDKISSEQSKNWAKKILQDI